jgi:coenzyme F420-dependent glucose-6-phosphate dehydrogenase
LDGNAGIPEPEELMRVGYHCSHEQFAPSELLRLAAAAEAAGFDGAMSSDHFSPWAEAQGQSGFAWSFLGAALQATRMDFGVVNAPGYRYHPAIIAQAAATLAEMFPNRLWVAFGSGELANEQITGIAWPSKVDRNARLRECVDIVRALWRGETVDHRGHVVVREARLFTRPARAPTVVGAALSPQTARFVGGWADALVTVNMPPRALRETIDAFREGGGGGKPVFLQVHVGWGDTDDEARRHAWEQWRWNALGPTLAADLRTVRHFEEAARHVRPADLDDAVRISGDVERHLDWLRQDAALGVDRVYLHNVGRNQRGFIDAFGPRIGELR